MVAMGMDKLQDLRSQISKNGKRKRKMEMEREKNMVSADKLQELLDKSNKLLMKSREDVWKLPEWERYRATLHHLIDACHQAEHMNEGFFTGERAWNYLTNQFAFEAMDELNKEAKIMANVHADAWEALKKTKEWKVMVKAMKELGELLDERKRRMEKEGEEQRVID